MYFYNRKCVCAAPDIEPCPLVKNAYHNISPLNMNCTSSYLLSGNFILSVQEENAKAGAEAAAATAAAMHTKTGVFNFLNGIYPPFT